MRDEFVGGKPQLSDDYPVVDTERERGIEVSANASRLRDGRRVVHADYVRCVDRIKDCIGNNSDWLAIGRPTCTSARVHFMLVLVWSRVHYITFQRALGGCRSPPSPPLLCKASPVRVIIGRHRCRSLHGPWQSGPVCGAHPWMPVQCCSVCEIQP